MERPLSSSSISTSVGSPLRVSALNVQHWQEEERKEMKEKSQRRSNSKREKKEKKKKETNTKTTTTTKNLLFAKQDFDQYKRLLQNES